MRQSFYVGDVAELEHWITRGYEIVAACTISEGKVLYTLQMK